MPFKIQTLSLHTLALLFLSGCSEAWDPPKTPMPAQQQVYFPNQIAHKAVYLQLAISANEKTRGLMFRDSLATDHGLCFVSDHPRQQSFWMRNTQIPLELAHFDAQGVLVEIHQLDPFDETPVKSRHPRIQYSIEMNQGWFKRNKIRPGSKLNLHLLQQAIRARSGR